MDVSVLLKCADSLYFVQQQHKNVDDKVLYATDFRGIQNKNRDSFQHARSDAEDDSGEFPHRVRCELLRPFHYVRRDS